MQSSNSGSQRLPRAALWRSHFLRLAAGALFPFVGWRLPAAGAPNPEPAQNSGAPGTKQAAGPARTGTILVSQFGPVKWLRRTYGDRAAAKVAVPTETITEGPHRIDGVTYDFRRFVDAESDLQLAALLLGQKVLMAFDLVFSPNQHAFTGAKHFDHWSIVLESLKAVQGYDTIIIGHDTPVDRFAIDSTMAYVKRAKEIHASSADAKTHSENLKAAFPNLQLARFVDLSARYLYAAPIERREPARVG